MSNAKPKKTFKSYTTSDIAQIGFTDLGKYEGGVLAVEKLPIFGESSKWIKQPYFVLDEGVYFKRKIEWYATTAFEIVKKEELEDPVGAPDVKYLSEIDLKEDTVFKFDNGVDEQEKSTYSFETGTDGLFKIVKFNNKIAFYHKA